MSSTSKSNSNENGSVSPRNVFSEYGPKQKHNNNYYLDKPDFASILITPKKKFDFIVSAIQNNFPAEDEDFKKEMTLPPFTETRKNNLGNLSRALAALVIAINSIASDLPDINGNTVKNLLKPTLKPVPERYLEMFEQLNSLFGEIVYNNFHISRNNDVERLTAKNHPNYLLHPASSLESTIDLANKIRKCITQDKDFQIATIAYLNVNKASLSFFKLYIHLHVDENTTQFVFHINDKEKFDTIDELYKHALKPRELNSASNSIARNPHHTFTLTPVKRNSNCNNSPNEETDEKTPLLDKTPPCQNSCILV